MINDFMVIKRDGTICSYDNKKIKNAISKALKAFYFLHENEDKNELLPDIIDKEAETLSNEVEKEIEKFAHAQKKLSCTNKQNTTKNLDLSVSENLVSCTHIINVEEIQDIILNVLNQCGKHSVAIVYSKYRDNRNWYRMRNTALLKAVSEITNSPAKDSNIKRDNGNVDGDTAMGTMLQYGSVLSKDYTENELLLSEIRDAVKKGDIYIHDKDFYPMGTLTCTQIPLDKLFKNGFNTGHGSCRSPQSIETYAAQTAVIIQANQNDNHGGQAIPLFDFYLAPGVKKSLHKILKQILEIWCISSNILPLNQDVWEHINQTFDWGLEDEDKIRKLLFAEFSSSKIPVLYKVWDSLWKRAVKEVEEHTYQAMESLIANLNTMHSRAGAQVPFSSLNFGMDTSEEGRMVSRNLLRAQEEGLGHGETSIFPITIFQVKEGINYNPEDKNYDLFKMAIRVSSKRLFPNFVFVDAPFNLQYYDPKDPETIIATMGCRTRVIGNVNGKQTPVGRGNLSFSTINLPALGIRHGFLYRKNGGKGFDEQSFFQELDYLIDLVKRQLLERYELQKSKRVANFPFLMGEHLWRGSEGLSKEDSLKNALDQGTLSLGFIGLAECLTALIGHHHGEDFFIEQNLEKQEINFEEKFAHAQKKSDLMTPQKLGLKIIGHMRKRMDEASNEYGLNFSLLATPAEGLSGTFTSIDKKRYGIIHGVTDRAYYTNSFHIPVYYPIGFEKKIQLEAPYHALTNAGHISYVEVDGDLCQNLEAFEMIVRCMKENGIGYGSINHPVDRDPVCGYTGIIDGDVCPGCGRILKPVNRSIAVYIEGTAGGKF